MSNPSRARTADLKLEVVVIPVSDVDRAKRFYGSLGWRLDADFPFDNFRVVQFAPPGSGVRFNSARTSRRPRLARPTASISSYPTSRQLAPSWSVAVSTSARCSTPGSPALSSSPTARAAASADRRPITPAMAHSPRSATRTATAGCCRRSRRGCPAGSTRLRLHSHPRRTWRVRYGVLRLRTASTRSAPDSAMRTGPIGTPRTWWRSKPASSCHHEHALLLSFRDGPGKRPDPVGS